MPGGPIESRTLRAAEKFVVLKGNDFSRPVNAAKSTSALAAEGCFSSGSRCILRFSATCLATEGRLCNPAKLFLKHALCTRAISPFILAADFEVAVDSVIVATPLLA